VSNILKDISILYVEDEPEVQEGYAKALRRICDDLLLASNGEEGYKVYQNAQSDIVISDIKMPVMNGLDMIKKIKEINPDAKIIITTAHSESAYMMEAISYHVDGYLLKPVDKKSMIELVEKIASNIILERENETYKKILQYIINSKNTLSLLIEGREPYFASRSFLKLFGIESVEKLNKRFSSILEMFSISEENLKELDLNIDSQRECFLYKYLMSIKERDRIITIQDSYKNNRKFYVNIAKINARYCLVNLTDFTNIDKEIKSVIERIYIDGLTKIYNRNKLEEVFEYEVKQYKRHKQPFSVVLFDIDFFKNFNDTYGHMIGDEILVLLTESVRENIRQSDLFVRWGGEEFVILFTNTILEDALKSAEKLRRIIESLEHELAGNITASFGLTQFRENDDINALFLRADEAMYEAKSSGRNCIKFIK